MGILEWFRKVSGLAINIDKTNVVKTGLLRDRSVPCEGYFGLKWVTDFEILGIKYRINHMDIITDDNISYKITDIRKLTGNWNTKQLTTYGKVAIIKCLLMSTITHILLSRPSPPQQAITQLEVLVASFLLGNKPSKFRKEIVEDNTDDGGLKLHNSKYFDAALKIGWLKRYLKTDSKWKCLP